MRATFLAASVACFACGATLAFEDDPPSPGAADASASEGGSGDDGGGKGDAAPITCSADCAPGRCEGGRCTPFVVWQEKGAAIVGVTSWGDSIFFTDPRTGLQDGRVVRLQGAANSLVQSFEPALGSVKAVGEDLLMWAKGVPGAETFATVFKSTFDGASRTPATAASMNGCRGFVYFPPETFFCGIANTTNITKMVSNAPTQNWVFGGEAVLFVDGVDPDVVWSTSTSLRAAKKDAVDAGAGAQIIGDIAPVGVAVRLPWVYFTQKDGSLWRVKLDGKDVQTLAPAPSPSPGRMGDLSVTRDGARAYWVKDDMIMGAVLAP